MNGGTDVIEPIEACSQEGLQLKNRCRWSRCLSSYNIPHLQLTQSSPFATHTQSDFKEDFNPMGLSLIRLQASCYGVLSPSHTAWVLLELLS